mmetsp:Transcript_4558/g.8118  ORF Transcript_4558/g.8118 Transcript_4558/m.8118 type:complete len:88 (-) Transcript_4558:52-315(-)
MEEISASSAALTFGVATVRLPPNSREARTSRRLVVPSVDENAVDVATILATAIKKRSITRMVHMCDAAFALQQCFDLELRMRCRGLR